MNVIDKCQSPFKHNCADGTSTMYPLDTELSCYQRVLLYAQYNIRLIGRPRGACSLEHCDLYKQKLVVFTAVAAVSTGDELLRQAITIVVLRTETEAAQWNGLGDFLQDRNQQKSHTIHAVVFPENSVYITPHKPPSYHVMKFPNRSPSRQLFLSISIQCLLLF